MHDFGAKLGKIWPPPSYKIMSQFSKLVDHNNPYIYSTFQIIFIFANTVNSIAAAPWIRDTSIWIIYNYIGAITWDCTKSSWVIIKSSSSKYSWDNVVSLH